MGRLIGGLVWHLPACVQEVIRDITGRVAVRLSDRDTQDTIGYCWVSAEEPWRVVTIHCDRRLTEDEVDKLRRTFAQLFSELRQEQADGSD